MPRALVLATGNPGKLAELLRGLEPPSRSGTIELLTPSSFPSVPFPPETGSSYRENATAKAQWWACRTDQLALADDSGLEVAWLAGAPGVHSDSWAGPGASSMENNRRLLEALQGAADRRAVFRCCLALAWPDGRLRHFEGACEGTITERARGRNGFGYDPLFLVPAHGLTLAELAQEDKDRLSHRGRALGALRRFLESEPEAIEGTRGCG
ncbi:MAG TPA: RdgB/HAM1 family non-canonical purine NTP pyrophosphatase [Bacillota bacterium]|nr:RdgB/HAM1 family non-canonical purine NTP pyrophosphatase [Bacillota bacterium]